jgi:phosphoglycerol transferase
MVVAGQLTTKDVRRNRPVVFLSAAVMIALIIISFRLLLRLYAPSLIDSPELHGVTMTTASFYIVGILGISALLVWAFSQRRGAQLALFLVMPVTILVSTVNGNSGLRALHLPASVEDKAGIFAHDELDSMERHRLVVVGSEMAGLYHVLFYVDDPRATLRVLPQGAPVDPNAIPADHDWVLLMGNHALPDNIEDKIAGDGYILFHLPVKNTERPGFTRKTVSFSHPFRFGLVDSISGASVPELFGRWSDGKQVQIKMSSPLPRRFDLRLMARAFGPNEQLPFTMRIGDESKTFRLPSSLGEVTLPFTTDGNTRTITIEVPQPTSRRQLGQGKDDRQLGIALVQMSIETQNGDQSRSVTR